MLASCGAEGNFEEPPVESEVLDEGFEPPNEEEGKGDWVRFLSTSDSVSDRLVNGPLWPVMKHVYGLRIKTPTTVTFDLESIAENTHYNRAGFSMYARISVWKRPADTGGTYKLVDTMKTWPLDALSDTATAYRRITLPAVKSNYAVSVEYDGGNDVGRYWLTVSR